MVWNLQFPLAQFRSGRESIDIELDPRPRGFIRDTLQQGDGSSEAFFLQFEVVPTEPQLPLNIESLRCGDAYVRDSDLIAIYPQEDPWPFGYQVDLRFRPDLPGELRGIELWLSVSTSLLACHPTLHLIAGTGCSMPGRHDLPGSDLIAVAANGRGAILVHPLDQSDCEPVPSNDGQSIGHWDVFGGFMEKGVIRRARFLMAWHSTPQPDSTWQQALDWFSQLPLPLTA